jgi:aspartate aminotransferase
LRRSGVEVIDFGAGEPDFNTPDRVKGAGHSALDANFTRYTPVAGIADLKRAICDRYKSDYGVEYKESEVIVTAGGKQALFNAALALFGPGDEVITHAPYWPTLTEQIKLADATPVLARTYPEDGFAVHAQADPRRGHAAHARHHRQLARQSHRRADLGSDLGRLPTSRRDRASGWSSISVTRS